MKQSTKKIIKEYILMTLSIVLLDLGIYFFKFPNNFAFGGVTGISMIVTHLTGGAISNGSLVLIMNCLLLVVGFIFLGKDFGIKTVYCSLLMSLGLKALEAIYPMTAPFTNQPLLELTYAVALPAIASAILFNIDASTGGTDIIAMLFKKYTPVNIGRSLLMVDSIMTVSTLYFFGIQTGLLCCLGLMVKSLVIDSVIESINLCKYFTVICEHPEEISEYITNTLHRSATLSDATGAFSKHDKKIIITILSRSQARQLKNYIKQVEPTAFCIITNTSEILGRGFRG